MNFYSEYANIPNIPFDILLSKEEILALPDREYHSGMRRHRAKYNDTQVFKRVNPEVKIWLKENFNVPIFAYYMIYNVLADPHVDIRPVAYNYFIETGGDIDTVFYNKVEKKSALWNSINPKNEKYSTDNNDPLIEITRFKAEKLRWVKLQTDIPHGTEGIMTGPRIFITVTEVDGMPIDNSPISESLRDMATNW